jgi:hypothetical protein
MGWFSRGGKHVNRSQGRRTVSGSNARLDRGSFDDAIGSTGFGRSYHQAFGFRRLPDAGALQWAWLTLTLPMYTPIGGGVPNQRCFVAMEGPLAYVRQGVTIQMLGDPGILTGQFVTQPLLDTSQPQPSGLQIPAFQMPGINELPRMASG